MRLVVAVVGRPRDPSLASVIRDYEARAARYWPLDVREVREEPARASASDVVRAKEGERLIAAAPPGSRLVACDESGETLTSHEFASWLQEARERARDLTLLIGGAYGLAVNVREQAERRPALAPWAPPPELPPLVPAEQLYPVGTLLRRGAHPQWSVRVD